MSSIDVALRLPQGTQIDTIHYTISGCPRDLEPRGEIHVRDSDEVKFQIGHLPATPNAKLKLKARTRDGVPCKGSATFAIEAGATTELAMKLTCGEGDDEPAGNVRVNANVESATNCPTVSDISAKPRETKVGETIQVEGFGTKPGDELRWSAATGTFAKSNAAATTYTCAQPGKQDLTFTISRDGCEDGVSRVEVQCTSGSAPTDDLARLSIDSSAPALAFAQQEFSVTFAVTNSGNSPTARNVVISITLPSEGTFVSSSPNATPSGNTLRVEAGDVAGLAATVGLRWRAPSAETTLHFNAIVTGDNVKTPPNSLKDVPVGLMARTAGGATVAGTALRHRDHGESKITDIPSGANVVQAVLVWALLYESSVPSNQITFEGKTITADLKQTVSNHLCWGDTNTIGFAADVTSLVDGNGTYSITNPVNGVVREDSNPAPTFPVTDGASLVVLHGGSGFQDTILADFTYSAENGSGENARHYTNLGGSGGPATLYLAGPDGQSNFGEQVRITGASTMTVDDTWNGSDPIEGQPLMVGNLWDTDKYDVSSILPASQKTLDVALGVGPDCTGVSAVVLQRR